MNINDLQTKISNWLDCEESRDLIEHHGFYDIEDENENFNLNATCEEELVEGVFNLWKDGSQWYIHEETKLGREWGLYLCSDDYSNIPKFKEDAFGSNNQELLEKYCNNSSEAEKCILRVMQHKNDCLCSNYLIEIVTTPDDNEVIGWVVMAD